MILHHVRFFPLVPLLGAFVLLFLGVGPHTAPPPVSPARSICTADVEAPLRIDVVREDPVRPGRSLGARVEVTTARDVDGVTVRYRPQPGIGLVSAPTWAPGRMRKGETRVGRLQVTAPPDRHRRTLEVEVEYFVDGIRFTGGAILNLVFEEEASRTVTTSDGRRIREVAARRIG
jgi:hypothetical protein